MKRKERWCCFIPDQSKLDESCPNPVEYEAWPNDGSDPYLNTDSCVEHLGDLLDGDVSEFIVRRVIDD